MRGASLGLGVALLVATAGCGSRSYIQAKGAKYPISMSSRVRAPDGRVLGPSELEKVGDFRLAYKSCRMLWTIIPLWNGTRDISGSVNRAVTSHKGEAIVNLRVESGVTLWNVFTLLGVLPDCSSVKIYGDVVARKPEAAPAPANTEGAGGTPPDGSTGAAAAP